MASSKNVAEWMLEELDRIDYLYQDEVSFHIRKKFGDEFIYINRHGNLGIEQKVLDEFRKLTEGEVVWDRTERMWRYREDYDPSGQRQVSS